MPAFAHEARIHRDRPWSMRDSGTLVGMDATSPQFRLRRVIQQETSDEP